MKNRKSITIISFVCLAVLLTILPLLVGCGAKEDEPKTLKVGMITPSTGPAAEKGAPGGDGLLDAVKYINEELGGVNGYPPFLLYLTGTIPPPTAYLWAVAGLR